MNPSLNNFWIHLPHSRGTWCALINTEITSDLTTCGEIFD